MPKGIVRRTFLFASLLTTAVTVVSFCILYFALPDYYEYKKERDLEYNINVLVEDLRVAEMAELPSRVRAFSQENNVDVLSFREDEALIPSASTPFINIPFVTIVETKVAGEVAEPVFINTETDGDAAIIGDVTLTIESAGGDGELYIERMVDSPIIHHITVSGTLQPIDEAKGVLLSLSPYVLLISVAIGLALAWVYARRISKPILRISDAAVSMQAMEPGARSGIRSDDELGLLSRNLDALYKSLHNSIDRLRGEMENVQSLEREKTEMMQSASHELKTPVAALSGMLDGMIDGVGIYRDRDRYLAECRNQVDKLSGLVGEILTASRADAPEVRAQVEVDPGELLRQALREHAPLIGEKALQVEEDLEPMSVKTDATALYRALSNLVSNAVRYTPKMGGVCVRLDATAREMVLENTCEPVPSEELDRLFEPFYTRSYSRDRARNGTGLGLYIVRRTLNRLHMPHKMECTDEGLRFTLWFDGE